MIENENKPEIAGAGEPLIISPEEATRRLRTKSVPAGPGGKYAISRAEATSIAVGIGQQVYDQLCAEHALSMGELQQNLKQHFGEIRHITATNILDLQRRSFSYRIRRDFDVDLQRMAARFREWWELVQATLELHGLRQPPPRPTPIPITIDPGVPPDEVHVRDAEGNTTKIVNLRNSTDDEVEPENVGAPSELPEDPGIARAFTLSSGGENGP